LFVQNTALNFDGKKFINDILIHVLYNFSGRYTPKSRAVQISQRQKFMYIHTKISSTLKLKSFQNRPNYDYVVYDRNKIANYIRALQY